MDKKQYTHPTPCSSDHDYGHDMHKVEDYLRDAIKDGYRKEHLEHLGGVASLHDHLTDLHYGHACMIKKELKRVMDYLFMYATTGHNIFCHMAEDAYMHVEQLQADVRDPSEKEHIQQFLTDIKEYMGWLKAEKTGTHFDARQPMTPSPSYGTHGTMNL